MGDPLMIVQSSTTTLSPEASYTIGGTARLYSAWGWAERTYTRQGEEELQQ